MKKILPLSYYRNDDPLFLARDLLGKVLYTYIDGVITSGIIIETEAYRGEGDAACHGKICTPRTQVMYDTGGKVYVYLCYGLHTLFNIVTNKKNKADAILIRAIEPLDGVDTMKKRIGAAWIKKYQLNGPGKVAKALGITMENYGDSMVGPHIWIEDHNIQLPTENIWIGPRVGVDYAGKDALLPWRFIYKKIHHEPNK